MYDISYLARRLLFDNNNQRTLSQTNEDSEREIKDIPFTILFLVNLILIIYYGFSYGIKAISAIGYVSSTSVSSTTGNTSKSYESSGDFVGGIFLSVSMGIILSITLVLSLSKLSYNLINATIVFSAFVLILTGIALFTSGYMFAGFCFLLLAAFCLIFYLYMKSYIIFASVILSVACKAVEDLHSLVIPILIVLMFQSVFGLLWLCAVIGVATNESNTRVSVNGQSYSLRQCSTYTYYSTYTVGDLTLTCDSDSSCSTCICSGGVIASFNGPCTSNRLYGLSYFLLLLSLFWTFSVCSYLMHCTVAASVNKWWSTSNKPTHQTVLNSFYQSLLYSFGSICFGSLFVAIIKSLRAIVYILKSQLSKIRTQSNIAIVILRVSLNVLTYLLSVADSLLQYFNEYAFCFVAIYGYSFIESSRASLALFRDRGWLAIINDNIIDYVLLISHGLIGIICSLLMFAYCQGKGLSNVNSTILIVFAYNCGHFMSTITTSVIASTVSTIFVCFAEKAELFEISHPELHRELMEAWTKFHPDQAPSSERTYDTANQGGYLPPHVADNHEKIRYNPVFNIDDEEDPRNVGNLNSNSKVEKNKTGFILSGGYNQSPDNHSQTNSRGTTNTITNVYTNIIEGSSRLITKTAQIAEDFATYMKAPSTDNSSNSANRGNDFVHNVNNNSFEPSTQMVTLKINDVDESISF